MYNFEVSQEAHQSTLLHLNLKIGTMGFGKKCLLLFLLGCFLASSSGEYHTGSVYINPTTGEASFKTGKNLRHEGHYQEREMVEHRSGVAYGYYNRTLNSTGWNVLEIKTRKNFPNGSAVPNTYAMYGAGYLEGVLTAEDIWMAYTNIRAAFIDSSLVAGLRRFYDEQDKWMRKMIQSNPDDVYWRHVSYIVAQFDGLCAGYRRAAMAANSNWDTDKFVLQMLNGIGDYIDLSKVIDPEESPEVDDMDEEQLHRYMSTHGHCSALIKVTAGLENVFMSHNAWFSYSATNRVYKHYHFDLNDDATAGTSMSFSSYPGFIESLDDFYIVNSGLVMIQTTLNNFNDQLNAFIQPESLFAWQRVRVAHFLARTGREWFDVVKQHNSGTYNNQYMIVDLKRVKLRQTLEYGTLFVVEQLAHVVVGEDQTEILRAGYWPSYNVPFYELTSNISLNAHIGNQYPMFSFQAAPRAKIFRRDQGKVVDMQSMKALMRSNDYLNDEYAAGNAGNAICSRPDLGHPSQTIGCFDAKATDVNMARQQKATIINGPTRGTGNRLPPFSWTGNYAANSHIGLPTHYDFDWIETQPRL